MFMGRLSMCFLLMASSVSAQGVDRHFLYNDTWIATGVPSQATAPILIADGTSQVVFDFVHWSTTGYVDKTTISSQNPSQVYAVLHVESIDMEPTSSYLVAYELKDGTSWNDEWTWTDWGGGVTRPFQRGFVPQISNLVLGGDANLDGVVDSADLNRLALHWGHTDNVGWFEGDFNGDGLVNATDLNQIGINWQKQVWIDKPAEVLILRMNLWEIAFWGGDPDDNGFVMSLSGAGPDEFVSLYSSESAKPPMFYINF